MGTAIEPNAGGDGPAVTVKARGLERIPRLVRQRTSRRAQTVHALLGHHRRTRLGELDRDVHFSWPQCFISIFSYALLLSDVLRTGLGIRHMRPYEPLEPDSVVYFGPYAYPGVPHLTTENATTTGAEAIPYWLMKYDSTSIGMRALVRHATAKEPLWPPCVTYDAQCDERQGLTHKEIFSMVDTLIDHVATYRPLETETRHAGTGRSQGHVTLRAAFKWLDRLHHHILPWLFLRNPRRTIQAIHYGPAQLQGPDARLCGSTLPRPFSCTESWTNFRLSCPPTSTEYSECGHVTDVWSHILKRYRLLERAYPNMTIEILLVEATEDFSRRSLVYQGRRYVDVVSLFRIRDCPTTASSGDCVTRAIDDYRYEAYVLTTSAADWFRVIAAVRAIGQLYPWVRLGLLFGGCYVARGANPSTASATMGTRLGLTIKTLFLIPSQVVIYGSVFPIACYLVAHLLDSALVYELVARKFSSLMGTFNFSFVEVVRVCAVSMRSVWVAAIVCHVLVFIVTHRSWSPVQGIPGVREFSISFIASLSIFAQARAIAWRNTDILEVYEVASSLTVSRLRSLTYDPTRGFISQFFLGTTLDPQCLMSSFMLLSLVVAALWLLNKAVPRIIKTHFVWFARTPVPYGAGRLWSSNGLVVNWHDAFVEAERLKAHDLGTRSHPSITRIRVQARTATSGGAADLVARVATLSASRIPVVVAGTETIAHFARYMVDIDHCPPPIESTIFLINLANMTDPWTFLRLRFGRGRLVGLYESTRTQRCFLLPMGLATSESDVPIHWDDHELLMVINCRDLDWWDLLQSG